MSMLEKFPKGRMPREDQKTVINQIEEAIKSGYPTILLCAPTGMGKSHIAATFANYHRSSYIITAQKILQDQYSRDFAFMRPMKGKSNFPCLTLYERAGLPLGRGRPKKNMSCSSGICSWRENGKARQCDHKPDMEDFSIRQIDGHEFVIRPQHSCVYYAQKYTAILSPHSLHNYATYLYLTAGVRSAERRDCIVADEAHDIENQIVSFVGCTITDEHMRAAGHSPLDFRPKDVSDLCDMVGDLYLDYADMVRHADKRDASIPHNMAFANALRVAQYEIATNPNNMVFQQYGNGITMRPISIAHMASRMFNAKHTMFMSATLHPEMFAREMGLDERDCKYIEVRKSSFSAANRQVRFLNVARLGNKAPDFDYRKVYMATGTILRKHRNEKGLILATSKKQCSDIMQHLDDIDRRRILTIHGDAEGLPADVIRQHQETSEPTVLLSPSLWHGVDLKDDLSRFQVILKTPYLSMQDRRTRVKAERDRRWYMYASLVRFLQGIGRSVRSQEDRAITYVLDSATRLLLDDMRQYVPESYIEVLY